DDAVQNLAIGQRFLTAFAIEHEDRHAPQLLARDTPVRPGRDHVRNTLLAPGRSPFDGLDGVESALAQLIAVHADEPLFGGAENRGAMASPAVRIAVLDVLFSQECAGIFQYSDDDRVGLPDGLAD